VRNLGELERTVMDVLWEQRGPMTVRAVGQALAGRELAYTTVMTVLDRLVKKGLATRTRTGRAWAYTPSDGREAYIARLMLDALELTGDRAAALAYFARSVSSPEAAVLHDALDAAAAERARARRRGA
jgi:predicted transcriptional regulator